MTRKYLICFGLLIFLGCATAPAPPLPDPCSLLNTADIESLVEAKTSTKTSPGLTVTQCYFRVSEESKSVTLELTRAASPRATRALWNRQFEPGEREEREGAGEVHGVEVRGVGDDAMWTGNRVSGALYVRTPDTILRISLGGAGRAEEKLERAKELANHALQRLRQ